MEQFVILSNTLPPDAKIKMFFATAYNRYGEGKPWRQERVRQFFEDGELLIGKDFWDFVCRSGEGYNIVLETYKESFGKCFGDINSYKITWHDALRPLNNKGLLVSGSFSEKNLSRLNLRHNQTIVDLPIIGREEYLEYHRNKIFIQN